MAQFKALNSNVQVNGETVLAIANGMGAMKNMGFRVLAENNINQPAAGSWYLQQDWLNAFKQISEKVGPNTLFMIGKSIPDNAVFPPEIDNIYKALASIDVAYHMNHRLNNQVLFNPSTGKMTEGIGHYYFSKINDSKLELKCNTPYPCDFDKGIIKQMAERFKPQNSLITLEHNEAAGCRKTGDSFCSYTVSW
jgi:hypothetical protein